MACGLATMLGDIWATSDSRGDHNPISPANARERRLRIWRWWWDGGAVSTTPDDKSVSALYAKVLAERKGKTKRRCEKRRENYASN